MEQNKDIVEKYIDKYRGIVIAIIILMISVFTFFIALGFFSSRDHGAGFVMILASTMFLILFIISIKKIKAKKTKIDKPNL